ncbi:MAG: hypothetical protein N3D75_04430 [Candidatus Aenigmarchaeota archaeon]|nr:hypothetical protein [Candidatus Aenigmarchaeota archaeon]
MKLEPREIINTCSQHYYTWKEEALNSTDPVKAKKFMEKAFFWLELQNSLLMLWTIEKSVGNDPIIKEKIDSAQANINKKIMDYASSILDEMTEKY